MSSAVSNGIKKEIKEEYESDSSDHVKEEPVDSEDDDVPLVMKMKQKEKKRKYSDSDADSEPVVKKVKKEKSSKSSNHIKKEPKDIKKEPKEKKESKKQTPKRNAENGDSPKKKAKKEEDDVWRWWEEEKPTDGTRWKFLEHKGPVFAAPYEPLPKSVKFYYDGKHLPLSQDAEEVALFYAKMLDHEYTKKEAFNKNFFGDWRSVMTHDEQKTITRLEKCDFKEYFIYSQQKTEERKNMTKEEKQKIKETNQQIQNEYGFCLMDGHKQKIANFRIEPPGLFRGRGSHPKMGMLKKRVRPEDIIINCSRDSEIPKPPAGRKWKEIRHDPKVTWLACWVENVQGNFKYVMLNASSRLKGEKDWKKYETARKLHKLVDTIRASYHHDFKSREMRIRQRAVALYFIDKLALRAGNEKDEDEADTVGCCSLRYEHIKLHKEFDGRKYVVEFDFLGKDSIRYNNKVPVLKRVFKNLKLFMENKKEGDDLFDRLNTTVLNTYLKELMDGLTAKVFRTYNASKTLEDQLQLLTKEEDDVPNKILSYNRANRAVAILCNHQRAVPKTHAKSMENMQKKIQDKKDQIHEVRREAKKIKADFKKQKSVKLKTEYERKKKRLKTLEDQLTRLEVAATDKDENKEIALGTSKLNYLDPRISVAWCKKWKVPIERVYSKTHRDKFQWAIDMADADFVFQDFESDKKGKRPPKSDDEDEEEEEEDD